MNILSRRLLQSSILYFFMMFGMRSKRTQCALTHVLGWILVSPTWEKMSSVVYKLYVTYTDRFVPMVF